MNSPAGVEKRRRTSQRKRRESLVKLLKSPDLFVKGTRAEKSGGSGWVRITMIVKATEKRWYRCSMKKTQKEKYGFGPKVEIVMIWAKSYFKPNTKRLLWRQVSGHVNDGELMRENGEIIDVDIDYPWTPPLCSHCCRIGHIVKSCIYPAAQVSHQDNAATATASVSLQGYSPHVQMDKGMQNNSTTTPPPLLPDPISQAETVVVDKMQVDSIVANPSTTSTLLESDSQLAVDLIADATPLPLVPETVTGSLQPFLSPSPSPILNLASPLKPISLPKSSPLLPNHPEPPLRKLYLSQNLPPPLPPPPTLTFTSFVPSAQIFVGLPVSFAPISTSYIARKQAAAFNSPIITLPTSFYDKTSTSWQATSCV
ncbi:hypothetical protein F2Q68_00011891 [Brassica cretica]|uniref:DUF4283 domain-containing protein n=1 Tax=Brassica cretica TaxID=69181 RepID=A0A8S9KR81_BRACR|nr:hypothetical protein F2Q68_00011891 [Brassica cretica]